MCIRDRIRGSVKPGFTIQAGGDVKISGGVDSANITCGGTLTVGGGIQGQGRVMGPGDAAPESPIRNDAAMTSIIGDSLPMR